MNLNTLKRGFTKTNPEKGLLSLSGAQKNERHDPEEQTIRVKGQYIEEDHDKLGKVLGFTAFSFSCLCNFILVLGSVMSLFPDAMPDQLTGFLFLSLNSNTKCNGRAPLKAGGFFFHSKP